MFELLFLLLPVAAAYGYYMGRNSVKNQQASHNTKQTTNYLRGVDFLLNDDKEQAMDTFIAYLDSSAPSLETSLALGNLFRQRGEVDKAITLHTSLANDVDIEPYESELARLELARDFISAGLLDRAELLLQEMVEIPRQRKDAVALLLKVYEQERDFEKAIEIGQSFSSELKNSSRLALSHYYCELAQSKLISSSFKDSQNLINTALHIYPNSIRARVLQGELILKDSDNVLVGSSDSLTKAQSSISGDQTKALKPQVLNKITNLVLEMASLDSSSGMFGLELLRKAYLKSDPSYQVSLEKLIAKTKSAAAIIELSEVTELRSRQDAEAILLHAMQDKPNLKLFAALMGLRSRINNPKASLEPNANQSIMQLKSIVDVQIAATPHYACSRCGFESSIMFWQCPSCRYWDTMRAKRGLDGD